MKSLIIGFLLVTGVGSAVVLAIPGLVVIGLIAGILPGIILGALPTAFIFGALFAAVWFPLNGLIGEWPAAVVAAVAAGALMYVAPIPGNRVTEARYRAELVDDMLPPAPIALRGDILLHSVIMRDRKTMERAREERRRPLNKSDVEQLDRMCGSLCTALLFSPGVRSVTIDADYAGSPDGLSPTATTFILVPRAQCTRTLEIGNRDDFMVSGGPRLTPELKDYWSLRLSTDRCLVRIPAVRNHDWRLVSSTLTTPLLADAKNHGQRPLLPRSVEVRRLEIFDRTGKSVLRQSNVQASRIGQPLSYLPGGSPESFGFRWGSAPFGKRDSYFVPTMDLLVDHAGLDLTFDSAAAAAAIRARLASVVADPTMAVDQPTIDLVPAYFKRLNPAVSPIPVDAAAQPAKLDVGPADVELVAKLVRDRRFTNFDNLYAMQAGLKDAVVRLRGPIVDRLLAEDMRDWRAVIGPQKLGETLARMPPGTFAALASNEAALLADPSRRTLAPGLIRRQSDRGGAAAPLLANIIAEHMAMQNEPAPRLPRNAAKIEHGVAINAAIRGLTRIGPAASAVRPQMEALAGKDPGDYRLLMLIRLGKPIDSFVEPERPSATSSAGYHARLRQLLTNYERDLAKGTEP